MNFIDKITSTLPAHAHQPVVAALRHTQVVSVVDWAVQWPEIAGMLGACSHPLVVADANTLPFLPEPLQHATVLLLPKHAHATQPHVDAIIARAAADGHDALVALGSGTINDLCKYSAAQCGLSYLCIPTAPSMNGYLSRNASIEQNGIKHTLPATLPRVVAIDAAILAAAPARLCAAGFGDSMARDTAQLDWRMSHQLAGTAYDPLPFALLNDNEPRLLAQAAGVRAGDAAARECLLENLLLSGLGMTLAGGSHPASQGEHLIAHALEAAGALPEGVLHGEIIAITTLTMRLLQQRVLAHSPQQWATDGWQARTYRRWHEAPARIARYYGAAHVDALLAEYHEKFASPEAVIALLEKAQSMWATWQATLLRECKSQPARTLQRVLIAAGCPTRPEDVGVDAIAYKAAIQYACLMRKRITFLDLAYYLWESDTAASDQ